MICICGGLNEEHPAESRASECLGPTSEAVWEGLGGTALLEEVHHRGWALRLKTTLATPGSLCLQCAVGKDVSSRLSASVAMFAVRCHVSSPREL